MKYLQEITVWDRPTVPNHIYYLNDNKTKMIGYIPVGSKSLHKFVRPISIDVRGRKFIEVKNLQAEDDSVYFGNSVTKVKDSGIVITGSNGKSYKLNRSKNGSWTCTCPGYTFRRTCKHLLEHDKA